MYYKDVANLFNLRLEEDFVLEYEDKSRPNITCKFTTNGLYNHKDDDYDMIFLDDLLSGEAKVIKLPFEPKQGEMFYAPILGAGSAINSNNNIMFCSDYFDKHSKYHKNLLKRGLCFKTQQEANKKSLELLTKLFGEKEV